MPYKDISSCLNNYFTSIAAKLANSLPKTTSPSKSLNTVSTCSSLFIKPVIDEDIIRQGGPTSALLWATFQNYSSLRASVG